MRQVLMIVTAIAALAIAPDAHANLNDAGDWYQLAGASDHSSTLYMLKDDALKPKTDDWTLVAFLTTKAGPGVSDGVFGQYRTIFFDCNAGTMGLLSYTNLYRTGDNADSNTSAEREDVIMKSIDMSSQFGLAYQIVCGSYDPHTLPETGTVSMAQLMETDIAAYDATAGQPYAY